MTSWLPSPPEEQNFFLVLLDVYQVDFSSAIVKHNNLSVEWIYLYFAFMTQVISNAGNRSGLYLLKYMLS